MDAAVSADFDPVRARIAQAYDGMSKRRWLVFDKYCLANELETSLLAFVEYLISRSDVAPKGGEE